ncbi:MAG: ABC transporter permease [Candidatus Bathyarchaeales archaeon]
MEKNRLLTDTSIILLVIGSSFLVGTIYRSTNTAGFTLGSPFGIPSSNWSATAANIITYALPPRDLNLKLEANGTIDIYLLDNEGIKLWLLDGTLKPVWSFKNASKQTFSIQLTRRDIYAFLVYNPNNSTITFEVNGQLHGFEWDLLWFSLSSIAIGSIITGVSLIVRKKSKKLVREQVKKKDLATKNVQVMQMDSELTKVNSMKVNSHKQVRELIMWELEEYLSFPSLEILIIIAIFTILSSPIVETTPALSFSNLISGARTIFMFLIFVTVIIFSHSYAGSIERGETKMLLSYPVKRGHLFLAKFTVLFTVIFIIYAGVFALQIYLLALNILEPLFYTLVLFLALQILLICSVTTALSLITKSEIMASLLSTLFLFGLENIAATTSLISFTGRFIISFAFISKQLYGVLPSGIELSAVPTIMETCISLLAIVGISFFLIMFSYIYYSHKMEID